MNYNELQCDGVESNSLVHESRFGDLSFKLKHLGVETTFHLVEYLFILFPAYKRDAKSIRSKSTSTSNTMKIVAALLGEIIVYNHIHLFNIHTSSKHVSGDQNADFSGLELEIIAHSVFYGGIGSEEDAGEVPRLHQLLQDLCSFGRRDENDDLVEICAVQDLGQSSILLVL